MLFQTKNKWQLCCSCHPQKNPQDTRRKSAFCFHLLKTRVKFIIYEGKDLTISERTMSYYVQHDSFKTLGYSSFTTSATKALNYLSGHYASSVLLTFQVVQILPMLPNRKKFINRMDQPAKPWSLTIHRTLQWMQRCTEQNLDSDFYVNNSEKAPPLYYTRTVLKNDQSLKSWRLKIIFLLQALTKL